MAAGRVRVLVGSVFSAALVMSLFVTPAAAACALSAPAAVDIGSPLTITGSGFPASSTVDVSMTIDGGSPDEFTVPSDASGTIAFSLTPEAIDAGMTTVVASSGADCTAEAVIAVGVEATTETPESTDAGGGATAPRTDGIPASPDNPGGTSSRPWLMASLLFLLGLGGLYATRPARSR